MTILTSQSSAPTQTNFSPNFKVVGFYTKCTPYAEEIIGLQRTCEQFGIKHITRGYRNRKKWEYNCAIKPEFLLTVLTSNRGKRLVYLDADARIKKAPVLFNTIDADIAIHFRRGTSLLSGTIFFKCNPKVKQLFEAWVAEQIRCPDEWDQKVLARVLKRWDGKLEKLPASYCQIFDSMKHHGEPVIEHLQASRRFKKLVEGTVWRVPPVIHGAKVRISSADGSYWIPNPNKQAEAYLDEHCIRLGRKLRWIPRIISDKNIDDLRPYFIDKPCYIVGKGPSLDNLRAEHFDAGIPIIALNEAIHAVEELELDNPLYALQQDAKLRATCQPKRSPILVSTKAANYYAHTEDAYIFSNAELDLNPSALSVSAAIRIARRLGAQSFKLICFDACINKKTNYAKRIGYKSTWGGKPERFFTHRAKIIKHAHHAPIQWIIPEDPAEEAGDKSRR